MKTSFVWTVAALVATAGATSLTGCATVVKGTTQEISVATQPSGARVQVDGAAVGTTPATITLSRRENHVITLEREGYEPESVAVTKSIGRATGGNVIAGGVVGWGVDAMSGAQYDLAPARIDVRLRPAGSGSPTADNAKQLVAELDRLDQEFAARRISAEDYARQRTALFEKYPAR